MLQSCKHCTFEFPRFKWNPSKVIANEMYKLSTFYK
uniref:Uncharacterized protein n=1 Tax=Anguilla anguilla TaxID=7936 RepID=A0A0E9VL38_ANGAN